MTQYTAKPWEKGDNRRKREIIQSKSRLEMGTQEWSVPISMRQSVAGVVLENEDSQTLKYGREGEVEANRCICDCYYKVLFWIR